MAENGKMGSSTEDALRQELAELQERVANGFQGGCYCCEIVAIQNQKYEKSLNEMADLLEAAKYRLPADLTSDESLLHRINVALANFRPAQKRRFP